jgi:hypothetical protein
MAMQSIVFGVLLVALALFGYFGASQDSRSPTALIPLAVGVPVLICGLVALKEAYKKHAMHVAAGFGALGTFAAGGRGIPAAFKLLADDPQVNSRAVMMVLLMFVLCAVFLGLCVKSFIDARRRQRADVEYVNVKD